MRTYQCNHCLADRDISLWEEVWRPHLFSKLVYMKCPVCGRRSWMRRIEDDYYRLTPCNFDEVDCTIASAFKRMGWSAEECTKALDEFNVIIPMLIDDEEKEV